MQRLAQVAEFGPSCSATCTSASLGKVCLETFNRAVLDGAEFVSKAREPSPIVRLKLQAGILIPLEWSKVWF